MSWAGPVRAGLGHLCRLWRDRNGFAAMEFALMLPVMLGLLIGTVELGGLITLDRRVTSAAQTVGDLIAQERDLSLAEVDQAFVALEMIVGSFNTADAGATVYSVVMDDFGNVTVDWFESRWPRAPTAVPELPPGLLQPGSSVVVTDIRYRYRPAFGGFLIDLVDLSDTSYLRPRQTKFIEKPR